MKLPLSRAALTSAEDALFADMRARMSPILRDGAMHDYATQERRLLFVLKEGNDPDGSWSASPDGDLRQAPSWDFHDTSYRRATWHTLLRWAAVVLGAERLDDIQEHHWQTLLPKIAVVNLCKSPGGSTTDPSRINRALDDREYAKLLRLQLGLYQPGITVCGGDDVFDWLTRLIGWTIDDCKSYRCSTDDLIWCCRSETLGLVIAFWHPAQRKRAQSDLVGVLGEVIESAAQRII